MAKKLSPAFELAINILGIEPLPKDIIKQLDELKKDIPEEEIEIFNDLYDSIQ